MLLSRITVDPERFQFRAKPWSATTVEAILAEGLDVSKFDPVAVIIAGDVCTVAGDGHSRIQACRLLAAQDRLPAAWRAGGDWEIPTREVSEAEARKLSYTANLSRDDFAPMEESRVYTAMLADGMTADGIALLAHKSPTYVRRMMSLNTLAACIRERVGKPADAGGIDKSMAQTMAELFVRYKVDVAQQQEFFNEFFAHGELTPTFVRNIVRNLALQMQRSGGGSESMLFAARPSVRQAAKEMAERAKYLERAKRGLDLLLGCGESGVLDLIPELKALLNRSGDSMLAQLQYEADADGAAVGRMALAS